MMVLARFREAVAWGGLDAGIEFVKGLSCKEQNKLLAEIERGGGSWISAWIKLILAGG